jgi:hypothetical protein
MGTMRTVENVNYSVTNPENVRAYVIGVAEKEWEKKDFDLYGDDLYKSEWKLEEADVDQIKLNEQMLATEAFQNDLKPRIQNQIEIHKKSIIIPPLILRGKDLFIFDGYARYHFFKLLGVKKCLAYVGHIKELS